MVDTFLELKEIARLASHSNLRDAGRDRLIRFLDSHGQDIPERQIVDTLCAALGLFPYMSEGTSESDAEALALEFHTPDELAEEGFTFHSEQQAVYSRLMDGESIILSAPTSFGKSAILDALVASNRWSRIVLIVPTVALIDETRRRLARFKNDYSIVTGASQPTGERAVYVLTQERFLEFDRIDGLGLFVIDEFYKLGTNEAMDQRRSLLNLAWKRLRATGAQYYLIGPNVDSISAAVGTDLQAKLIKTEFRTVAVDVIDRSDVEDSAREADLFSLISANSAESTLVFSASPEKAEKLAVGLREAVPPPNSSSLASEVARWLGSNYDPAWNAVGALAEGVATHTGLMPRSVQRIMVRLFNDGDVPVMVCTSTLIEGVNTAAKNVVIYDHKIDGQLLDFFTFSNIRGRAGRMFRHFVGRVYTYAPAPKSTTTEVDIPIESQSTQASAATLAQLDWEDLDDDARERVRGIFGQDVLSLGTIRANRGLDPELQINLAKRLIDKAPEARRLGWQGVPASNVLKSTLETAWDELLVPRQRRGVNFQMVWGQLQNHRVNGEAFSAMVDQQERYLRPDRDRSDAVLDVFRFQRRWMEHTIPSFLRGVQAIQGDVAKRSGLPPANYEFALREIESLYLPPGIAELEEFGVPMPLGLKLYRLGVRGSTGSEMMHSLEQRLHAPDLTAQLGIVERWILDDVVSGWA